MRKKDITIFAILLVLGAIALFIYTNPSLKTHLPPAVLLRQPEARIEKDILALTPIGTSFDDVLSVIDNQKDWRIRYIDQDHGFSHPESGKTVGKMSIRVFIGDYTNIFMTSVTVFWGFDEDGKLIDIYIWKDPNVL